MFEHLRKKIQRIFLAGLIVTVPTMITFFLLKFLVNYIDDVSAPVVERLFHTTIPGIGFIVTIFIVFGVGMFGTNFLGKKFVALGEFILSKIPFVRGIYASAKQIIELVFSTKEKPFQQVVLVPYPHTGVYALGLLPRLSSPTAAANESEPSAAAEPSPDDAPIAVFVPSTPNFTSGMLVLYRPHEIIPLSMPVEAGFKYLMSGGLLSESATEEEPQAPPEWELFLH